MVAPQMPVSSLIQDTRGFLVGTFQRQNQMRHTEQPYVVLPAVESDMVLGTETWTLNPSACDKYQLHPFSAFASSKLQNLDAFLRQQKAKYFLLPSVAY